MFRNFKEIEEYIFASEKKKTIVLAGAHDAHALQAITDACNKGIANAILVGHEKEIIKILNDLNEDSNKYKIIDCEDEKECSKIAVQLIKNGEADIPMKGLLQTSDFLKPILNKTDGLLKEGDILSQATLVEYEKENRFFAITDCAVNITPDIERKKKIISNAVNLFKTIGIDKPNVAVITALEVVNPKMPNTVEAQILTEACQNGEIKNCEVYGPLALDNAISKEAAKHKKISSVVAGNADILLMPEITVGNVLTKSLIFFTSLKSAGVMLGTTHPLIMASRTDSHENKYNAILMGLLQSK